MARIDPFFKLMSEEKASDLHLATNNPPMLRINGDLVRVSSKRGTLEVRAVVTKRLGPLQIDGQTVYQIGIPIHWGFVGVAKQGYLANRLTPSVGDANTQTPEYKAFLVNIEKA